LNDTGVSSLEERVGLIRQRSGLKSKFRNASVKLLKRYSPDISLSRIDRSKAFFPDQDVFVRQDVGDYDAMLRSVVQVVVTQACFEVSVICELRVNECLVLTSLSL
jgi:hypothetical protein